MAEADAPAREPEIRGVVVDGVQPPLLGGLGLDALEADPDNQEVLVTLLLSLTDQFDEEMATSVSEAWKCADRLRDEQIDGSIG